MTDLPPVPSLERIRERLPRIFPEGTSNRNYCTRDMAARTVFVMLYAGAVAGRERWVRPDQITRMTDRQAARTEPEERLQWTEASLRSGQGEISDRWYAPSTREPIRDETIRDGFIPTGVVIERQGLPTTSPRPRYALADDFAALFDPALTGSALEEQVAEWQAEHLSAGALARVQILRQAAVQVEEGVQVRFPNGEARRMAPGPSSVISKAVIEQFAPRFLKRPGVIFLSESRNKVVARDDALAQAIGLRIEAAKNLPDVLLVDLGPREPLLVFVEVVATGGEINERRKQALRSYATEAGYSAEQVAFVTAYKDRNEAAFKRTVPALAWRSFAWFIAEPDRIVVLREHVDAASQPLTDLLR